jgi:hypothetical protein
LSPVINIKSILATKALEDKKIDLQNLVTLVKERK